MGSYRVYKVGEDEYVREAAGAAPAPLEGGGGARRRGRARAAAPRRWWIWALIAAAAVVAAVLYWFYGREAVSNSRAALDLAKLSGKVPDWAVLAAPVIVVAAIALVTAYVAFGRSLAVKLIGVAVVVLVLATPGLAVGYANGLVSDVGGTGTAAKTPEDTAAIAAADQEVDRPIPNKPMNVLLIGSDKSTVPGDPGRSDTQMLVRLDPETKSISMLSLPRDLQVDIPGRGLAKMNEAYSLGGPALVIKTFKQLTGLPVNGWIEVNFSGFWHVVNILGGIYLPIDHKYFVPASADYKSINLEPGYQLVRGKQALNYVRYRHDQRGDFTRMQRQQLFLREVQRQSGPLEQRLDEGAQADQGDHRRDQVEPELAQEDPAARAAGLRGGHVEGLPGPPRGRHADDRRRLLRDRDRSADRRRRRPVHQPDAGAGRRPRARRSARRCSRCRCTTAAASPGWRPPPRRS